MCHGVMNDRTTAEPECLMLMSCKLGGPLNNDDMLYDDDDDEYDVVRSWTESGVRSDRKPVPRMTP